MQGHTEAQHALALCHANGLGVEQDAVKAVELFASAAEKGFPPSMIELSLCFERGIGVGKDQKIAVGWAKKAAALGDARAQYALGQYYAMGAAGESRRGDRI